MRDRSAAAGWRSAAARRAWFTPRALLAGAAVAWACVAGGIASAADYQIEVGDVLEFSVASLPALKQRTAVDINGDVNLPLLQDIHAAGLPLAELRNRVRELISAKPFRQRGADGRETLLTIDPDEITIGIVEYRPIYITGDVGRPGEQPFRPGITVRQAVALGGGVDAAQSKLGNPTLQVADLRSDYQTAWTSLLGQRATIARLQAELDNKPSFEQAPLPTAPLDAATQRTIIGREKDELATRVRDYNNQKSFLAKSVSQADSFLSVLKDQQANEKQGADLDAQDFNRVNDLFAKGAVPITRVIDARRSLLLSSTRQLQTGVQVSENQIRREGLLREQDKLDDGRRAQLLADLQAASLAAIQTEARLQATSRKLAALGKSGASSADEPVTEVQILRRGAAPITATDDAVLAPGDVIRVRLKSDPVALLGQ